MEKTLKVLVVEDSEDDDKDDGRDYGDGVSHNRTNSNIIRENDD